MGQPGRNRLRYLGKMKICVPSPSKKDWDRWDRPGQGLGKSKVVYLIEMGLV